MNGKNVMPVDEGELLWQNVSLAVTKLKQYDVIGDGEVPEEDRHGTTGPGAECQPIRAANPGTFRHQWLVLLLRPPN